MRWHVEATLGLGAEASGDIDSDATVEADSWQRALQAARALRGERSPMSGFSTESLSDGSFRAVDPIKRVTFVVRSAGNEATLGVHKAPSAMGSSPVLGVAIPRPNVQIKQAAPVASASATLIDAQPPPPDLALDDSSESLRDSDADASADASAPAGTAVTETGAFGVQASANASSRDVTEDPTVPLHPALDPDATDETMATMPLPSASALEPVVLFRREQSPSPAAPLHYREYVLALPTGTNEDEAEVVLRRELARVQKDLANHAPGKLVNLAAFDEMFTGPPSTLPLVTLTWKDWRGEPVIDRPRRRGTALPVQPMSFPPPPLAEAEPEVLRVSQIPRHAISVAPPPPPPAPLATPEVKIPSSLPPAAPVSPGVQAVEAVPAVPSAHVARTPPPPASIEIPVEFSEPRLVVAAEAAPPEAMHIPPAPPLPAMRRQADSLIPVLFEAMHDLAFLRDSIEGADFCLDLALQELPATAGVVHLYDMERRVFEVIAVRGESVQGRLHTTTPDGDPRFRTAAREGVSRGQSEAPRANSTYPASLTQEGDTIMAPIVKDGRYLGAIEIIGFKVDVGDGETNALTYIAGQYAEFVSTRGTKFKASVAKIPVRPRGR